MLPPDDAAANEPDRYSRLFDAYVGFAYDRTPVKRRSHAVLALVLLAVSGPS